MINQYIVLKPIKYKNPDSPAYGRIITPDENLVLTFPHLSTLETNILVQKGVIAKLSTQEVKGIEQKLLQNAIDAKKEIERKAAVYLAQKKQAMEKMKNYV